MNFENRIETLLSAILAGVFISLGGIAYLSVESTVVGAFLFSIGLIMVCAFNLDLYTGKVGYIFQVRDINILIVLGGNFIGAWGVGQLYRLTDNVQIIEKTIVISQSKTEHDLLSLFILAIFCNVCIYLGVEGYKRTENFGRYFAIIISIMVFIMCGFEHSIADMFYFTVSGWNLRELISVGIIICGNATGGIAINNLLKLISYLSATNKHVTF